MGIEIFVCGLAKFLTFIGFSESLNEAFRRKNL
jgi:hypothetical protein